MNFYAFIPKLLNMSLTASVSVVFVLLLRLMLKKAPKVISYALWAVVLFRLLCPVSIESSFSLFGLMDAPTTESTALTTSIEYVPENIVHTEYPAVTLPVPGVSDAINSTLPQGEEQLVADPLEAPVAIATWVWFAGVLGMAAYSVVSYLRLRRKLLTASPLRDNIYLADEITSPFVMGLLRPKIYLPSDIEEREQSYIIRHEQHHIRRGDHIIKALAFLALSIHWFNPLVWVAFICSNKDMEMSCDEAVVKKMGDGILADYTASLLSLATGKHIIAGMPLTFGEGDTKGRIRNLANWKKPAFRVIVIAAILCIAAAVCLLTNPKRNPEDLPTVEQTYLAISSKGEEFDVGLKGHSRDSVIDCWGEPDGMLSGFWGDIWKLNGLGEVIVYYDDGGNVEHIKVDQTGAAPEQTVKWTYSPMMSATWHAAFHVNFDLVNYSHMEASCDNGTLWNLHAQGQPREKTMRFEAGEPLCWMPGVGESLTDTAESAKVTFTVYDGGETVAKGVLDIKRTGTDNGQSFYEARLTDTQILALQQESGSLEASVVIAGNGIVVAYSDVNHNRINERVIVRELQPGMVYELCVVEDGTVIWSTEASPAHTGWNTVMLYSEGGQDYLVQYQPAMFQGVGNYRCTVFSLDGGEEAIKKKWTADFELPTEQTPEMERFAGEVGVLLRNCSVLLSTEQGIVVKGHAMAAALPQLYPVRFDPDEIQRAIDGTDVAQDLTSHAASFPEEPLKLVYASGAGGWGSLLTLLPDGSFTGDYRDSEMGSNAPEYPNGSCYVSVFEGHFTAIQQISDYAWSMTLGSLTTERAPEEAWIADGVRYIAAEAAGVAGGETFILFAPGTPADEIPAECRDWWPEACRWRNGEIEQLEGWALCNMKEGTGFYTSWLS